jgi:hypothetical protein
LEQASDTIVHLSVGKKSGIRGCQSFSSAPRGRIIVADDNWQTLFELPI